MDLVYSLQRDIVVADIEFIKLHLAFITYSKAIPLIAAENLSQLYAIDEFKQLVTEQGAWNKLTAYIEKNHSAKYKRLKLGLEYYHSEFL